MRRDEFMNAHEVRMSELEKACENLNEIIGSDPVEGFEDDILDPSLESERGIQDIQTKNSQDLDDLLKGLENL
mgnify:FL=1|jgi:hypothetical protein